MKAVFKSKCPACGDEIVPDTEIVLIDDGEWVHEECAAEVDDGDD